MLNCKHCSGHYLAHMPDVSTPEKLKAFAVRHAEGGGVGILISGGSTSSGSVPLGGFYPAIRWIKDNTGLVLNLHTGLVDRRAAEEIAASGIDFASVDLVGSDETIKQVYGLEVKVGEYEETVFSLKDAGVRVTPHVCVGLDYGELRGEFHAVEIAASLKPESIVIVALIPTAGTPMAGSRPPSVEDVVKVVSEAKRLSPDSEVSLGCMHSRLEKLRLEWEAIEAGATRLTLPSKATLERARGAGFEVRSFEACCAIPRSVEGRALRV